MILSNSRLLINCYSFVAIIYCLLPLTARSRSLPLPLTARSRSRSLPLPLTAVVAHCPLPFNARCRSLLFDYHCPLPLSFTAHYCHSLLPVAAPCRRHCRLPFIFPSTHSFQPYDVNKKSTTSLAGGLFRSPPDPVSYIPSVHFSYI
jgi:hypothetical protein